MKAGRLFLGMLAGNGAAVLLFVLGYALFAVLPGFGIVVGLPSLLFVRRAEKGQEKRISSCFRIIHRHIPPR